MIHTRGGRRPCQLTTLVGGSFLLLASAAAGQDSASSPDSISFELSPIEVLVSIRPRVAPLIGSGLPTSIATMGRGEIDPWAPTSLTEVLTTRAGVSLYDDLGSPNKLNLSARGFNVGPTVGLPQGLSVFLDGIRQNEPFAQEVNFDVLPMDHVERVEFLRGNASLLGPNSQGGAVNLITRQGGESRRGKIEVSAGSFGARGAEANLSGGMFSDWVYYAGAGYEEENGWREATSGDRSHALVNVLRTMGESGVHLQALWSNSQAETAGSLPESILRLDPRVNFTAGDFEEIELQQITASGYSALLRGRASIASYFRRTEAERFNVNQPPEGDVRSFAENRTLGGTGSWDRSSLLGGRAVSLRLGVDAAASWTRFRIFYEERGGSSHELTTEVESPRVDLAGYAMAELEVGPALVSAGARADFIRIPFEDQLDPVADTVSSFTRLSPRAGASLDLGQGVAGFGSVGLSFRAPAILELACSDPTDACPLPFALGDDPPLDPVTATNYEVGLGWSDSRFDLSASLYRTDVRGEIFFVPSAASIVEGFFRNLTSTRREGVEMEAGLAPLSALSLYANYAYTRATFQATEEIFSARADAEVEHSPLAGENRAERGDRLPMVPEHQWKFGGSYTHVSGVTMGLDGGQIGPQWLRGDEANEVQALGGYFTANARAGLRLGNWEVEVIMRNVLDTDEAVFGTFNVNRRTGELERFLTPLNARSTRILMRRSFGDG